MALVRSILPPLLPTCHVMGQQEQRLGQSGGGQAAVEITALQH